MLGDCVCTPAFRLKQWKINVPLHKKTAATCTWMDTAKNASRSFGPFPLCRHHSCDKISQAFPPPSPSSILANCKQIEDFTVGRPWNEVAVTLSSLTHPLRLNSTVPLPTSPPLLSGTWTSLLSALRPQSTLTSLLLPGQLQVGVSFCGTRVVLQKEKKGKTLKTCFLFFDVNRIGQISFQVGLFFCA